ncbi:MAG: hypothetical protein LBH28_03900 [Oscillospiraceae bacterium]|jgi:hypothetical protein|nr:hypothetical protein [Oscillospiraceae bacterium]
MNGSTDGGGAFPVPSITREVDEPHTGADEPATAQIPVSRIPGRQAKSLEQQKFEHGAKVDKWATWILIGCIFGLVCVYVFERLIGLLWSGPDIGPQPGDLSAVVTETLKFLISSLIGFLFAKRTM